MVSASASREDRSPPRGCSPRSRRRCRPRREPRSPSWSVEDVLLGLRVGTTAVGQRRLEVDHRQVRARQELAHARTQCSGRIGGQPVCEVGAGGEAHVTTEGERDLAAVAFPAGTETRVTGRPRSRPLPRGPGMGSLGDRRGVVALHEKQCEDGTRKQQAQRPDDRGTPDASGREDRDAPVGRCRYRFRSCEYGRGPLWSAALVDLGAPRRRGRGLPGRERPRGRLKELLARRERPAYRRQSHRADPRHGTRRMDGRPDATDVHIDRCTHRYS